MADPAPPTTPAPEASSAEDSAPAAESAPGGDEASSAGDEAAAGGDEATSGEAPTEGGDTDSSGTQPDPSTGSEEPAGTGEPETPGDSEAAGGAEPEDPQAADDGAEQPDSAGTDTDAPVPGLVPNATVTESEDGASGEDGEAAADTGKDGKPESGDEEGTPLPLQEDAGTTGQGVDSPAGILGGLADDWKRTSGDASSAHDEGEGGARAAGESWQDPSQGPQQERTGQTLDETKSVGDSAKAMEEQVRRSGEQIDAARQAIDDSDRDAGSAGLLGTLLGPIEDGTVTQRTDAMADEERKRRETETAQQIRNDPGWDRIAPATSSPPSAPAPTPPPTPAPAPAPAPAPVEGGVPEDDPNDGSKGVYVDFSGSGPRGGFGREYALMFDDKGIAFTETTHGGASRSFSGDLKRELQLAFGFKETSSDSDQIGGHALALGGSGFIGGGGEVGFSADTNGGNFSDNIGVGFGIGGGVDFHVETERTLGHLRWEDVPEAASNAASNVYDWMVDVGRKMQEGGVY